MKPNKPTWSCGWIAPNGEFYSCENYHHGRLAEKLAKKLNKNFIGFTISAEHALEKNGWLKLYSDGLIHTPSKFIIDNYIPTQPQIDTIFDLSNTKSREPKWRENLLEFIKDIS